MKHLHTYITESSQYCSTRAPHRHDITDVDVFWAETALVVVIVL